MFVELLLWYIVKKYIQQKYCVFDRRDKFEQHF